MNGAPCKVDGVIVDDPLSAPQSLSLLEIISYQPFPFSPIPRLILEIFFFGEDFMHFRKNVRSDKNDNKNTKGRKLNFLQYHKRWSYYQKYYVIL